MKKVITFLSILGILSSAYAVNIVSCKACHGQNFEKKALGKSKVVKDMNKTEISTALMGYKDGTLNKYGMGGIMKGQVAKFNEEQIKEIAKSIKK